MLESYPLDKYNLNWQILTQEIIAEISGKENFVNRASHQFLFSKYKIECFQISETVDHSFLCLKEKLDHLYKSYGSRLFHYGETLYV